MDTTATTVKAPTQFDAERADWKAEYDRRLSTLDESSTKDKKQFHDWLNGFRIKGILGTGKTPAA